MLDKPIPEEEINKALQDSAPGKSPGPDWFTTSYLKMFKGILIPRLCQYINGLGVEYDMSREAPLASITVILTDQYPS